MTHDPHSTFWPQDGAIYEHRKSGDRYRVLMVARLEATYEYVVVYQKLDGTMPLVRPMPEFGERFRYVTNVG